MGDLEIDSTDFEEDGENFIENARKKARYFAGQTGLMTLAEDSGIIVNALLDELGVKTRRWGLGETANDEDWVAHFLERMKNKSDRSAKFVCAACLIDSGIEYLFEGETKGHIEKELKAPILHGIPLSSCFIPEGYNKVYAALGVSEKNKISHRGKAMSQARDVFKKLFSITD